MPDAAERFAAEIAAAEAALGDHGRVLVRPSGTEPLVRVMVEAPTQEQADATADRIAAVVRAPRRARRADRAGAPGVGSPGADVRHRRHRQSSGRPDGADGRRGARRARRGARRAW